MRHSVHVLLGFAATLLGGVALAQTTIDEPDANATLPALLTVWVRGDCPAAANHVIAWFTSDYEGTHDVDTVPALNTYECMTTAPYVNYDTDDQVAVIAYDLMSQSVGAAVVDVTVIP